MADFTIVRTEQAPVPEEQMPVVRQFLTRCLKGMSRDDDRAWHRFWKKVRQLEPGEILSVAFTFSRHGPTHRGYMKLETDLFDAQERFTDRENFRDWLKVGAGWVVWAPGAKGGIVPLPKSISFARADEEDFHVYVKGALEFIRTPHFGKYLWRHLTPAARAEMVDVILDEYDRFLQRFA